MKCEECNGTGYTLMTCTETTIAGAVCRRFLSPAAPVTQNEGEKR